jgi:serine/threonine-protein kinase
MPPPAAPPDRATFFDALRATELLSPAQLAKARELAPSGSAPDAAKALVAAGLLTRFQADRLLGGRADGFLIGPYVVLEQIGRGARSRVYRAKHRTMHRTVAIKVLSAALTEAPEYSEALRTGVRTAGKLAHPNIVTAYDANELNDRFYLVLEFVDGPDLGALVRERGPLPVPEACEYVRQIAAGLAAAHELGLVHRDLKPSNLLVARPTQSVPATIKITDFGLPKGPARSEFAAPELLGRKGAEPDVRSDLYSLGCVCYFLLTGRSGRDKLPLTQLRPDVPPAVAAIVYRLLAPDPSARFGSATELLAQLGAVCVPVAVPWEGAVNFELPVYPLHPGHDSGFLTGRLAGPADPTDVGPSPWEQITATAVAEGDTLPMNRDDTPTPPPSRPKTPGRDSVPIWMTVSLLIGVVLLCLMGIGYVVRTMAK